LAYVESCVFSVFLEIVTGYWEFVALRCMIETVVSFSIYSAEFFLYCHFTCVSVLFVLYITVCNYFPDKHATWV